MPARNPRGILLGHLNANPSKKPKRNQSLVSETSQSTFEEVPRNFYCRSSSSATNSDTSPSSKKPKRDQRLVSETSQSPFEIEEQKAKSEILFPGLHLLANVAVRCLENDVIGSPENSLTEEKLRIRKAIVTPTGVPFLQKRVPRIAKSGSKHHQPMLHDLQKSLSAANSQASSTADNMCKLGVPACTKQIENELVDNEVIEDPMEIPHARCSKRSRSQALPSKYRDFVLQPWK